MNTNAFNLLRDEFMPRILSSVDEVDTEIKDIAIDGIQNIGVIIGYATGNYEDDDVPGDEIIDRQGTCRSLLQQLHDKLQEKFNIDIEEDSYYDLIKVYKLFVLNRITTIVDVVDFTTKDIKVPDITITEEIASNFLDNVARHKSLEEDYDDYYMSNLIYFHDKIFFNTTRQSFYEAFFLQEGIRIDDLKNNPEVIAKIKTMLILRKAKQQVSN